LGIETQGEVALEIVTRTFPIGRGGVVERPDGKRLYYLPPDPAYEPDNVLFDADGTATSPFDEFNALAGAGLCGDAAASSLSSIPGGPTGPYNSCVDVADGAGIVLGIFGVEAPTVPLCDSVRATTAAVRISGLASGDWLMLGLPGEGTAPFAEYLRGRSPVGRERTLLVGYADEHAGYLLTSEDWLAGGYEPSTNLWGPREGEQIIEGILAAAAIALTPEREDPEAGTSRFEAFDWMEDTTVVPTSTTNHGTPFTGPLAALFWPDARAVEAIAATVPRGIGVARFAWYGGDPAVDFPEVVVEREVAADRFEVLLDERGRAQSSFDGVVVVTYTPSPVDAAQPDSHIYAATWQPVAPGPFSITDPARPFSLPTGRYRLRATGHAQNGEYEVTSTVFDIVDAPLAATSHVVRRSDGL
jgi:neutral ceramidase